MKASYEEFLLELAILIKRYPSDEWAKLAKMIEQPTSRSLIVSFLKGATELQAALGEPRDQVGSQTEKSARVAGGKDEKADGLEKLRLKLAHASARDLRLLAQKAGLRVSRKESKMRLAARIVRRSKPAKSASGKKGGPQVANRKTDDFGHWARIILGRAGGRGFEEGD
jgi:hypothetical protein